jgi:hypothetical protein
VNGPRALEYERCVNAVDLCMKRDGNSPNLGAELLQRIYGGEHTGRDFRLDRFGKAFL